MNVQQAKDEALRFVAENHEKGFTTKADAGEDEHSAIPWPGPVQKSRMQARDHRQQQSSPSSSHKLSRMEQILMEQNQVLMRQNQVLMGGGMGGGMMGAGMQWGAGTQWNGMQWGAGAQWHAGMMQAGGGMQAGGFDDYKECMPTYSYPKYTPSVNIAPRAKWSPRPSPSPRSSGAS